MKTYEPRRNNQCPNGLHADYNPDLDPTQNECTCPWLVIASTTPVQHLTSWSRRELENIIREMDQGYFDPPSYPKRSTSMFLSPAMQRLLDVAEKSPVAAALTLLAGSGSGLPPFDAIAWDAEDAVLSLRSGAAGGWRRLWLGHANVETVTDQSKTPGGVAPVLLWADHPDTAEETGLPEGLVATPHEPAQDYFADDITGTALPTFAADVAGNEVSREYFAVDVTTDEGTEQGVCTVTVTDTGVITVMEGAQLPTFNETVAAVDALMPSQLFDRVGPAPEPLRVGDDGGIPGFVPPLASCAEHESDAVVPLLRRVPQVPSDIAQAGHGDYCTCAPDLSYMCPLCRAEQTEAPPIYDEIAPAAAAALVTRGGVQFPIDVPEDVFRASQVKECGWALVDNAGTFVCTLPANHGNNHSDGGRAWYDSGTDDCTCDIRGSAPDTYACPEHPSGV